MNIDLRVDRNGNFAFVETFKVYEYRGEGTIDVLAVPDTTMNRLPMPYVMRGETYIPSNVIEQEMGIEKYVVAKKPIYSLVTGDRPFIIRAKVGIRYDDNAYLKEKSTYNIYVRNPNVPIEPQAGDRYLMRTRELLSRDEQIDAWLDSIGESIVKYGTNRAEFLKSRMVED